jgi:hypothetical protein
MPNENPDLNIAHITHDGHFFQVLNAEGTDWDEAATRATYQAWLATQPQGPN